MFKPHPGTAGYAKAEIEIFKGYLNSVYGDIVEYNVVNQSGNKEEHELPVFPIPVQYPFLLFYFIPDHRYPPPGGREIRRPQTGNGGNRFLLVSLFG
jgi:hypothetical protein